MLIIRMNRVSTILSFGAGLMTLAATENAYASFAVLLALLAILNQIGTTHHE